MVLVKVGRSVAVEVGGGACWLAKETPLVEFPFLEVFGLACLQG